MPSFSDSVFIFFIALLIFGPKKLPELARQLGKLMAEFRRASNEFRMQMEDELRLAEQAEQQKKIAAMETAAPPQAALASETENTIAPPHEEEPIERHPHDQIYDEPAPEPQPIASSGELNMMPPETGLPVASSSASSVSQAFSSIPQAPDPTMNPATFSDSPSAVERENDSPEPATEALHG
ncbi:hypothetical protein GCM10011507_32070 [Edaphobacter acidisoli]|uniref:Sec-independent protein translocase protein TatA n=1 Tax=Edaphobacter acidisoli TaxID=2040573 RepID=A0A916S226_9BACT|nr:twin-arginine translocase TatA/TatE family subunit [Edaphobacter acidisoli]GGA78430.1 hypothetical protein GCM10011507_32070 [Edaphobacter acidisoli]